MRAIVVGLGVQGYKRRRFAGAEFVAAVDPVNPEAQYKRVEDVPLTTYDAALACIPDEPKTDVLAYLLGNAKHVLVEKPLWSADDAEIQKLERIAAIDVNDIDVVSLALDQEGVFLETAD